VDDVRRNCLFSSVDVDDLLLPLFDRPIRLKNPLLINFLAVAAVVDDDDCCEICGPIIVLSDDVLTSKLFNGIGLSTDDDDCRFNKSSKKKNSMID
jgi:hypothetical protein